MDGAESGCTNLDWTLLAGIGAVESAHADERAIGADGAVTPPIVGPPLDGQGLSGDRPRVLDTDDGALDGDGEYDRAIGPMQVLPADWQRWGRDGNGDGVADPHNIFDAALGAATFLCGDGDFGVVRLGC